MIKVFSFVIATTLFSLNTHSQTLIWEGAADTDFYNELNWLVEGTQESPADGALESGASINYNMIIEAVSLTLPDLTSLTFSSSDMGIELRNASLEFDQLITGYVSLDQTASLLLRSGSPLASDASVDLKDAFSWIKLLNVRTVEAGNSYLSKVTSDGQPLTLDENVYINQYYYDGSLIRLKDITAHALTLYDGTGQTGDSFGVGSFTVYSDEELGSFENRASSFRLERGFVAVMAIFQNGTGKSETFIASEEELLLDLPNALDNTISFVRVMPWNWVTKKGASKFLDIGTTWTYNWNRTAESLPNIEYAPMAWGYGSAQLGVIGEYLNKENVTHLMGFNESDNCNGQSGQYNNLCQIEVAVPTFKNLMRAGLRLVSPSPRENGPLPGRWLSQFRDLAVETDVRYDVLGVHWYDWASNPANTPFEDAQVVFDRFKSYLDRVYEEHNMPIWITEFNANANRDASVHLEFLELALPYLESLDFIERYDYFEPNPEIANNRTDITFAEFYDSDGNITALGEFYRDFESTPAVPEATNEGSAFLSELDGKIELKMEANVAKINEGESLIITFSTDRSVGASESFNIEVSLAEEQYTLTTSLAEIPEGGKSVEVTLSAVDDDLVEDVMTGTITVTNVSSGIEWDGVAIPFELVSEDVEIEIPLGFDEDKLFSLYPNPTLRFVSLSDPQKVKDIQVINMSGKIMPVEFDGEKLDLDDVEAGVYIIRLTTVSGKVESTLIKKN